VRNEILKEVEGAYWDLYAGYWKLHSREQGLRLLCWQAIDTGRADPSSLARLRGQYELFRGQRLASKQEVAKAEQELRKLLNLRSPDKTELVPCDAPKLPPLHLPAFKTLVREALTRPEIRLAHDRYVAAEVGELLAPSLFSVVPGPRRRGNWAPTPSFNPCFSPPVRAWETWRDEEVRAEQFLAMCWRRLFEYDEQIRARQAQREAYGVQLRLELGRVGEQLIPDNTVILEAERFYTCALANEYEAIAAGAKSRCNFAFARGKLLEYDRDRFGSDLLRPRVGKELLERERKRTISLVRRASAREAAALEEAGGFGPAAKTATHSAITLPALWRAVPPLKEVRALPAGGAAQPLGNRPLLPYEDADLFP
jgi:hypothetical protein